MIDKVATTITCSNLEYFWKADDGSLEFCSGAGLHFQPRERCQRQKVVLIFPAMGLKATFTGFWRCCHDNHTQQPQISFGRWMMTALCFVVVLAYTNKLGKGYYWQKLVNTNPVMASRQIDNGPCEGIRKRLMVT